MTFSTPSTAAAPRPGRPTSRGARLLIAGLALGIVAGCASTPAGIPGYDAFRADAAPQSFVGSQDAARAAQCFEDRATFLPFSTFSRDPGTSAFTYRLRVSDLWFEEVRITPEGTGSRAEWRVAPNLDARWHGQLARDRIEPLRQCLAA